MSLHDRMIHLADTLWKFKEENVFCDTTIYANGGVEIYVHSAVLGAVSTKLRTKLQDSFSGSAQDIHTLNQCRKYRLFLTDFMPDLLDVVLRFMYIGQIDLGNDGFHLYSHELKQLCDTLGVDVSSLVSDSIGRDCAEEGTLMENGGFEDTECTNMTDESDVKLQKYEAEQTNGEELESVNFCNTIMPKTFMLKIPLPKHSDACGSFMDEVCITDKRHQPNEVQANSVSTITDGTGKLLPSDVESTAFTANDDDSALDVKDIIVKVENETESGLKSSCKFVAASKAQRPNRRITRNCKTTSEFSCKFKCCLCAECFTHKSHLYDHLKSHPSTEPFVCELCNKTFGQSTLLYQHYLTHCFENPQETKNVDFESPEAEIGGSQITCNVCQKNFVSEVQFKKHMATHFAEQSFHCSKCDLSFAKKVHLVKHEITHVEAEPMTCSTCNKEFHSLAELEEHIATHTGIQPHVCHACGKRFALLESLKNHESVHLTKKIYHCQVCNKNFKCLSYLKSHQKGHDGIKPFMCDVCGKGFLGSSNLKTHRRIHTGERPYACSYCDKRFLQICAVKEHEKIHLGNKQFVCDTCGKMFMTYAQLYNHLKIHIGIKAFVCEICNKRFFTNGDLTKHQRIHKDHRPFVCKVCGKGFKYSSNLHGHARIHSGARPYMCKTCGKDFTYSSHLSRHIKLHTKEKILAAEKEHNYTPVSVPDHQLQVSRLSLPTIFVDRPTVDSNFTAGFTTFTGCNMNLCN